MYHQSVGLNDSGANFKADIQHIGLLKRVQCIRPLWVSAILYVMLLFGGHPTLIFARTGEMNEKKIIQVRHPGEIGEPTQEQSKYTSATVTTFVSTVCLLLSASLYFSKRGAY